MTPQQQAELLLERAINRYRGASLDAETRGWVFQALRDITGQTLPPDASAWRLWYTRAR